MKLLLTLLAFASSFVVPPPGSPLRRDVLAALRPPVEHKLGPNVEFNVAMIRVQGNWAFVVADPQRKGGKPIDGYTIFGEYYGNMDGLRIDAILHKTRGRWVVVENSVGATDVWYCGVGPPGLIC